MRPFSRWKTSVPLTLFAAALSLGTCLLIGSGNAQATIPHGNSNGSGVIDCSAPVTVSFNPPMTASNAGSVVGTLKFKATGTCSGGSPTPSLIKGKGTINNFQWDMCNGNRASLAASISLKVTYPHQRLVRSSLSGGWGGFAVPGAWETTVSGPVTGSFATASPSISGDFSTGDEVGNCGSGITSVSFALEMNDF